MRPATSFSHARRSCAERRPPRLVGTATPCAPPWPSWTTTSESRRRRCAGASSAVDALDRKATHGEEKQQHPTLRFPAYSARTRARAVRGWQRVPPATACRLRQRRTREVGRVTIGTFLNNTTFFACTSEALASWVVAHTELHHGHCSLRPGHMQLHLKSHASLLLADACQWLPSMAVGATRETPRRRNVRLPLKSRAPYRGCDFSCVAIHRLECVGTPLAHRSHDLRRSHVLNSLSIRFANTWSFHQ